MWEHGTRFVFVPVMKESARTHFIRLHFQQLRFHCSTVHLPRFFCVKYSSLSQSDIFSTLSSPSLPLESVKEQQIWQLHPPKNPTPDSSISTGSWNSKAIVDSPIHFNEFKTNCRWFWIDSTCSHSFRPTFKPKIGRRSSIICQNPTSDSSISTGSWNSKAIVDSLIHFNEFETNCGWFWIDSTCSDSFQPT